MNNGAITISRQYSVRFLIETIPIFFNETSQSNNPHIKWCKIWWIESFIGVLAVKIITNAVLLLKWQYSIYN